MLAVLDGARVGAASKACPPYAGVRMAQLADSKAERSAFERQLRVWGLIKQQGTCWSLKLWMHVSTELFSQLL